MSKRLGIGLILLALIVGLAGGGFAGYKYYPRKNPVKTTLATDTTASTESAATTTTSSNAELETCLKAKWGEDKYTAITANPSLASVDDKFNALPCYK